MRVYIDFESYSEVNLAKVGAYAYSKHPSTRPLCLSWLTSEGESNLWVSEEIPAHFTPLARLFNKPALDRLFAIIAAPDTLVVAHNAFMEWCIWNNTTLWPAIQEHQWRCSAAKAAACALPRELGAAGRALSLPVVKDEAGHRVMLKLCKRGKKGPPIGTKEEYEALYAYCRNDTAAEKALDEAVPDLPASELKVWQMDQRLNRRGIPCDVAGAKKAISIAATWATAKNTELEIITGGVADKATQRERVLGWLQDNGLTIENTQGNTLDTLLEAGIANPDVRKVVEIKRSVGRSSIAKYNTLVLSAYDERLHDTLRYHGAGTGRWSANRFQPQNLVRGQISNMEKAWDLIHATEPDEALRRIQDDYFYSDPMQFLSYAIRGAIQASPGCKLYSGDYSAVETRVLFWLADEINALEIIRSGEDIYLDMASIIYGRKVLKIEDVARQLGKQAILGLGFGMGFIRYLEHCRSYRLSFSTDFIKSVVPIAERNRILSYILQEDVWARCLSAGMTKADIPELVLMKYIVDKYRSRYRESVVRYWDVCDKGAKAAVAQPGKLFRAGRLAFAYDGTKFLRCRLPSGRLLYYPFPRLDRDGLSYMGIDGVTHQWRRERTYGAKVVENAVQGTARDLMAEAMLTLEDTHYEVLMTVHDEIVSQSAAGNIAEYTRLISAVPKWAAGLPVKAESWSGYRYKK